VLFRNIVHHGQRPWHYFEKTPQAYHYMLVMLHKLNIITTTGGFVMVFLFYTIYMNTDFPLARLVAFYKYIPYQRPAGLFYGAYIGDRPGQ
jgi:hypothetical protein